MAEENGRPKLSITIIRAERLYSVRAIQEKGVYVCMRVWVSVSMSASMSMSMS